MTTPESILHLLASPGIISERHSPSPVVRICGPRRELRVMGGAAMADGSEEVRSLLPTPTERQWSEQVQLHWRGPAD